MTKQEYLARRIEPIGWTAHEFVLVRSLLGRGTHVPVMRWPLCA